MSLEQVPRARADSRELREVQVEEICSTSSDSAEDYSVEDDEHFRMLLDNSDDAVDVDGKIYLYWCDKLGTVAVSQILKYLRGDCVTVNHYGLGLKGLCALAHALKNNETVNRVELSDNSITDITSFLEIISGNRVIEHMNLSKNRIGMNGCKALGSFLNETTCQLKNLDLSKNKLTDRDVGTLLGALHENQSLQKLNLSRNLLTKKSVNSLCEFLMQNSSVTELDLSWNTLKAQGVERIMATLRNDATLKKLKLSWNGIADEGAALISETLSDLHVEELDLVGNGITATGFYTILDALSENSGSLKLMRLDENYINEEKYNKTLSSSPYKNLPVQFNDRSVLRSAPL